jgi:hypothetical protein
MTQRLRRSHVRAYSGEAMSTTVRALLAVLILLPGLPGASTA